MEIRYDYTAGQCFGAKTPHSQTNRCFPFTVFVYVCEGAYFCTANGKTLRIGQGETLVVPPYICHDIRMEHSGVLHWAHVSLLADGNDITAGREEPCSVTGAESEKLGECLKLLNLSQKDPDELRAKIRREKYIAELYDVLYGELGLTPKPKKELDEIYDRICREPGGKYTLSGLARLAKMSERSFETKFKQEYNITPMKYISKCRIMQAMHLLAYGKSVKETAQLTGYYDTYHFSKQFKASLGITPSEYAATHSAEA